MMRSVFINLTMLSATLVTIVWMGWPLPPDRGEAGFVAPPGERDVRDAPADALAAGEVVPQPPPAVKQPAPVTQPKPSRRSGTVMTQLDANHATAREFDQLPGISPALAQRIVEFRRSHGPFVAVEDLSLVKGIGPKKLDRLRGLVTVRDETTRNEHKGRL